MNEQMDERMNERMKGGADQSANVEVMLSVLSSSEGSSLGSELGHFLPSRPQFPLITHLAKGVSEFFLEGERQMVTSLSHLQICFRDTSEGSALYCLLPLT